MTKEEQYNPEQFVESIRQTFFSFLRPFLQPLPKYIDSLKGVPNEQKVFAKYFRKKEYLAQYTELDCYEFAKKLVDSTQFISFCDRRFDDAGLNNYRIFFHILNEPSVIDEDDIQSKSLYYKPSDEDVKRAYL